MLFGLTYLPFLVDTIPMLKISHSLKLDMTSQLGQMWGGSLRVRLGASLPGRTLADLKRRGIFIFLTHEISLSNFFIEKGNQKFLNFTLSKQPPPLYEKIKSFMQTFHYIKFAFFICFIWGQKLI